MNKRLSFFQTSAPDFDEEIKVEIPAPNVLPEISNKNTAESENTSAPKIEYSPSFIKTLSSPKKVSTPRQKQNPVNQTSFIKPKDPEKKTDDSKNYDVVYEYGKEKTYYEVADEQIPWSVYVTRYLI